LVDSYNEMNTRIRLLSGDDEDGKVPLDPAAPGSSHASPTELREAYIDALAAVRKIVDDTNQKYKELVGDTELSNTLKSLSKKSAKIKYTLGPSRKFQDLVKAVEQAEQRVTNGSLDEPAPKASPKRKKSARRK
jgi:hypothetical protein